jgi:hypothetical protein
MTITLEAIRAAGGIVHSDGNIFFRDISMLQGLAGAGPAAVAPQGEYPHLPQSVGDVTDFGDGKTDIDWGHPAPVGGTRLYSADQMRAYVDADRVARAGLPAAVAGPADEREAFEDWARNKTDWKPNLERRGDGYAGGFAQTAWEAWRGRGAAPALEAPAAPADGATPGPWFVRKREVNGELRDCFVAAPDCQGLAYDACILCDDEYHDGVGRKLADCELIVAAVNQHRAALAAAPQAPAVPVAVTTRAELEKLQGGAGSMATIFPADASGFPVRLYAEPAAPAVDAALNALIADVRALPTLRASEIDGEESDGTPKHWRNRPFVSLRKLELLLRDRVTASSDTALLNFIAAEYLDLRSFGMPTGQGDADVGWRVIQHHMGEPTERVVAEVYKDDPRSAIRAAIARLERDPYCTGALHEEDAAQAREGGAA